MDRNGHHLSSRDLLSDALSYTVFGWVLSEPQVTLHFGHRINAVDVDPKWQAAQLNNGQFRLIGMLGSLPFACF